MHLFIKSAAMFEPNYVLMCLRLAADCRNFAADVPEPDLRVHFLHMASMWVELADQPRVLH
jgi:hypothetical protein